MNIDLLFESAEEKSATERVLAAFKVKSLNKTIDTLITEILEYAKKIDDLLEENGYSRRYLDRTSTLSENAILTFDNDLESLNFRVKEVVEDLIKRINTRIKLIHENDANLNLIEQKYNLDDINLAEEIIKARLTEEYFV